MPVSSVDVMSFVVWASNIIVNKMHSHSHGILFKCHNENNNPFLTKGISSTRTNELPFKLRIVIFIKLENEIISVKFEFIFQNRIDVGAMYRYR